MAIENRVIIQRWADDLRAHRALQKRSYVGSTVRANNDGHLVYVRRDGARSRAFGPVLLGRHNPNGVFVLNGDGFRDGNATDWQTRLRNHIQQHDYPHIIIPYAAMDGAEIQWETVRPIHVTADRWETVRTNVEGNPLTADEAAKHTGQPVQTGWRNTYEMRKDGNTWRFIRQVQRQDPLELGPPQQLRLRIHRENGRADFVNTSVDFNGQLYWEENVHRLGASLFSAVGEDGRRHKFISAFDTNEPQPMYFLAQLPDGSGATTYEEALDALAPPLVHEARAQGRAVGRQGDVFAIETNLTDEEVYALARTRVRREVVLWSDDVREISRRMAEGIPWPMPVLGEVRSLQDCPCGCGHRRWYGHSDRARRALMIYGTAHTADEVVVTTKGVTYIRGTMYHDPQLETTGRMREHRAVDLRDVAPESRWFLAVRNTVPRRRPRPRVEENADQPTEEVTT